MPHSNPVSAEKRNEQATSTELFHMNSEPEAAILAMREIAPTPKRTSHQRRQHNRTDSERDRVEREHLAPTGGSASHRQALVPRTDKRQCLAPTSGSALHRRSKSPRTDKR